MNIYCLDDIPNDLKYAFEPAPEHGSEPTIKQWLKMQLTVFDEVRRIMRDDATLWLNLGDSYIHGELMGQPWLLAHAMKRRGWVLRADCLWSKPNPTPEPINRKRPTLAHEYIFLFTKHRSGYYYDGEAIKEQAIEGTRNRRTIWSFPAGGAGEEGHFAAFPKKLPELCIQAGTSEEGCCEVCAAPYERVLKLTKLGKQMLGKGKAWHDHKGDLTRGQHGGPALKNGEGLRYTAGWRCACKHEGFGVVPATVFDPYAGTATSGMAALELGRSFVGIELSKKWYDVARKRLTEGAGKGGRISKADLGVRAELGLMSDLERTLFNV